jgi:REP element-mobilizing transposase RayT
LPDEATLGTVRDVPPKPRDVSEGIHHVWVNATGNWVYYRDEIDRLAWIRRLVQTIHRHDWTCIAFCQMTTHVHLLLDVPAGSLAVGMKYLNLEYSKDFNARHARFGTFVRRRYGSRKVDGRDDLLGTYAYVVLNPVREGMCPRAEDWRWSSFATTLGISRDFPFVDASRVLDELGGSVESLRDFVASQAERQHGLSGHVR